VLHDFKKKYARATEIVGQIYSLPDEIIVKWIATSPARWNGYKRAVKIWFNWDRRTPIPENCPEQLDIRIVVFKEFLSRTVFHR